MNFFNLTMPGFGYTNGNFGNNTITSVGLPGFGYTDWNFGNNNFTSFGFPGFNCTSGNWCGNDFTNVNMGYGMPMWQPPFPMYPMWGMPPSFQPPFWCGCC